MNLNSNQSIAIPSYEFHASEDISVKSFELIRCIGQGAYGQVWLCEKNDSHVLYAMKILNKNQLSRASTLVRTLRERKLLELVDSPFIVKLRFSFQDSSNLYFVTDYYSGGDFFSLIEQQPYNRLCESYARAYLAEVIVALESLHSLQVAYRDLKMENILMTNDGHLILTDLGMSRILHPGQRSFSYVGTPEYMAPEIVSHRGHDHCCDFWSLGVLAYQIMVGVVPFTGNTVETVFNRISHQQIILPPFLSHSARTFISALLQRNPEQRLGHGGIQEIKQHRFFEGIDWKAVENHTDPLPLTPAFQNSVTQMNEIASDFGVFDRFAHFVDGTDRCYQKLIIKQVLLGWIHYDLKPELVDEHIHGTIPSRGDWKLPNASSSNGLNGYYQFSSRDELIMHLQNEEVLFPEVVSNLCNLQLSIEEKTMLFENDRCVCQWRLCG